MARGTGRGGEGRGRPTIILVAMIIISNSSNSNDNRDTYYRIGSGESEPYRSARDDEAEAAPLSRHSEGPWRCRP